MRFKPSLDTLRVEVGKGSVEFMSDANDFEPEYEAPKQRNPLREQIDRQAEELKTKNAAIAEGEQAKKELLFLKAGVNTDSKIGQIFLKGYDGELNLEAIRAEAVEAKLIEATPSNADHAADRAALGRIGKAAAASDRLPPVADIAKEASEAKTPAELMEVRKKRQQLKQTS